VFDTHAGALIVRATPERDRQWSLGCVFSRELSSDELHAFETGKVETPPDDQRSWVRFSSRLSAHYRTVGEPADAAHAARVLNISPSGIGLAAHPSVKAGALLNVDLHDKDGHMVRTILACVVHTAQRDGGDYVVGCNFIRELTEEELNTLV